MDKLLKLTIAAIITLMISSNIFAGDYVGGKTIKNIAVYNSVALLRFTSDVSGPVVDDGFQFRLTSLDDHNKKAMLALLMQAKAQGFKVSIWYDKETVANGVYHLSNIYGVKISD